VDRHAGHLLDTLQTRRAFTGGVALRHADGAFVKPSTFTSAALDFVGTIGISYSPSR
jgi:hypothetical protein